MAAVVSESDGAFYSFLSVMLMLFIVPSLIFTIRCALKTPKKLASRNYLLNSIALAVACTAVSYCYQQLQYVDTSGVFDPYEILHISDRASLPQIRKAYRKLGRELHPDKNRDDPKAQALFARVTKAYEALTDPIAIDNYRKYGHPDGRQSMMLDFALSFSKGGSSGAGTVFVMIYFALIFGVIAFVVYKLVQTGGRRDRTQISKRTAAALTEALKEKMSVHDIIELLLSTEEMTTTAGGAQDAADAQQRAKAHDKVLKKWDAAKVLPSEILTRIKKHPNAIARENMIALYYYLRSSKLRGVAKPAWVETRQRKVLLETPYLVEIFADIVAKNSVQRTYQSLTLLRTLSLVPSIAQGSLVADEDALRNQHARLPDGVKLPSYDISAIKMFVADETTIQPGDWITLEATITREHVAEGEKAPLAYTTFDEVDPKIECRKEYLWILVIEKGSNRLYSATKVKSLARVVPYKVLFEGPGVPGKFEMEVRVICSSYLNVQASASVAVQVERQNADHK